VVNVELYFSVAEGGLFGEATSRVKGGGGEVARKADGWAERR